MGKSRQFLGIFSGVGTGLVNFCVLINLYVSITYGNKKLAKDFHTAEVTGSNPVPPIDVKSIIQGH